MSDIFEGFKNIFALLGIITFASLVSFSLMHLYDLVKLYGLKNGIMRWFYGK